MDTKVKAYICSPLSAETDQEIRKNMVYARQCVAEVAKDLDTGLMHLMHIYRSCWMTTIRKKGRLPFLSGYRCWSTATCLLSAAVGSAAVWRLRLKKHFRIRWLYSGIFRIKRRR